MTIEQSLRAQLGRAFGERSWEENPLVTIGLSHAILSLKVTDGQLFRIVRAFIRQLASAVHPDTAAIAGIIETPELAEERRKIMEAFELIDDEKTFSKALEEFRAIKAGENQEIASLRNSLRIAQRRSEETEAQVGELGIARRELERERGAFALKKIKEAEILPQVRNELTTTQEMRNYWQKLHGEKLKVNRGLMTFIRWFQRYMSVQSFSFVGQPVKFILPSDAKQLSVLNFKLHHPSSLSTAIEFPLAEIPVSLREKYLEYVDKVRRLVHEKFDGAMDVECVFHRYLIERARIGVDGGERLVGSLGFDDVLACKYKRLERLPNSLVLRNVVPFLLPGSFLVSLPLQKPPLLQEGDDVRMIMRRYTRDDGVFCTRRIILDVR